MLFTLLMFGSQALSADTVSITAVRAEYAEVFSVTTIPPDAPDPFSLAIFVRRNPGGTILASYAEAFPYALTYLVKSSRGFDLAEIVARPGTWPERVQFAEEALSSDPVFEDGLVKLLGPYLTGLGKHLETYPAQEDAVLSFEELKLLAVRLFYLNGFSPDGQINAYVCTDLNAIVEYPGPKGLQVEAFVFSAVRTSLDRLLPDFENAMQVANRLAPSADAAATIARAQDVVWDAMMRSESLDDVLRESYATRNAYLGFRVEGT